MAGYLERESDTLTRLGVLCNFALAGVVELPYNIGREARMPLGGRPMRNLSENAKNNIAGAVVLLIIGAMMYISLGAYLDESAEYMEAHSYENVVAPEAREGNE